MTASERRSLILNQLTGSDIPCSAAALARQFGVSRQIIVGDIALLVKERFGEEAEPPAATSPPPPEVT